MQKSGGAAQDMMTAAEMGLEEGGPREQGRVGCGSEKDVRYNTVHIDVTKAAVV